MNVFMMAHMSQRRVIDTDDDVAKRYGAEATKPWKHGNTSIESAACNLNRAFDHSASRAQRQRNE